MIRRVRQVGHNRILDKFYKKPLNAYTFVHVHVYAESEKQETEKEEDKVRKRKTKQTNSVYPAVTHSDLGCSQKHTGQCNAQRTYPTMDDATATILFDW